MRFCYCLFFGVHIYLVESSRIFVNLNLVTKLRTITIIVIVPIIIFAKLATNTIRFEFEILRDGFDIYV